jgi:hypothetical protein
LRITRFAIDAITAATNKWHSYAIANIPILNIGANFRNDASEFMARNMWKFGDIGIVTLPPMPITSTKSSGQNLDNYPVRASYWEITIG